MSDGSENFVVSFVAGARVKGPAARGSHKQDEKAIRCRAGLLLAVLLLSLAAVFTAASGCARRDRLVVYCAHDAEFADALLRLFESRSGIPVAVRYDTEATKSLGLVELILREKDHPRCDVFWNNELLGTARLAADGVLDPYRGPGYEATPPGLRDPEARWTGFAARLRVWIVNTNRMEATPAAIDARMAQADLSRVAIAKPLYGTTRTHYTVLWRLWGADRLQAWHTDARRRGLREVGGNAMVRDLVAEGVCDLGLTDTDDAFGALDKGRPVAMLPARVGPDDRTICIPNTVAVIRGTRRLAAARQLVDFLLSPEAQLMLARSSSRQIPLVTGPDEALPADVRDLRRWAADAYPLDDLGDAAPACLAWLKRQYL